MHFKKPTQVHTLTDQKGSRISEEGMWEERRTLEGVVQSATFWEGGEEVSCDDDKVNVGRGNPSIVSWASLQ